MVMAGVRDKDGNPPTGHSILWGPKSAARAARRDALSSPPAPQQQPILRLRGGRAEPPLVSTVYAEYNALRTEFGRPVRMPLREALDRLQAQLDLYTQSYIEQFGARTFATDRAFKPLWSKQEELRAARTSSAMSISVKEFDEMVDEMEWADEDVADTIVAWDQEKKDQLRRHRQS
ncbi:MAG: hypothetical protein Q9212_002126 [Teloschistes hypoglaucus]